MVPAVVVMFIPTKGAWMYQMSANSAWFGAASCSVPRGRFHLSSGSIWLPGGVDLEGMVDHIFLAGHQVYQVPQVFGVNFSAPTWM